MVTTTALWFGSEERPLFGWVHVPDDGRVGGAVVLCPPLGLEEVCAHRTFRLVAERLAGQGLAAVRFDYDGTGDSAGGENDPGRVEAWVQSVEAAVGLVRAAGARRVVLVGMRMGATLAAAAAARLSTAVQGLLLWDPCASGRTYLREQQALGLFSLGGPAPDDGSVEVPGIVYQAATVKELGDLSIAGIEGSLAERVLVLVRPERAANKTMRQRLEGDDVEWGEAVGQTDLIEVEPWQIRLPTGTMDTVVGWISDVVGAPAEGPTPFSLPSAGDRSAVVERGPTGEAIVERIVSIGEVGLFGVVTEPVPASTGATVILLNAGLMNHVGPSRLWVDWARQWAAAGVRVLRFDMSAVGDSPGRPGQPDEQMYPVQAFDDLGEAVAAMGGPDNVVLTGLCSGGYHSVEGAIFLGVRAICVINPILTASPSEIYADGDNDRTPDIDPRRQATTARKRWVRALPAHDFLGGIVDRLPDAAWWIINRVAVATPPARIIERLVDNGVDTYVVCGEREARGMRRGQAAAFRRLTRSGRFHLEVMPGIDHELFARASRDRVGPVVTERILLSASRTDPAPRA